MPSFSTVKPVLCSLHFTKWMFWIKLSIWCRTTVLYINVRPCRNGALSFIKRLLLTGKTQCGKYLTCVHVSPLITKDS